MKNEEICGVREKEMKRSKRMIGGSVANRKSWPWQVAVVESGRTVCGGVIIAANVLLTAAHCITKKVEFVLNDYHSDIKDYNENVIFPLSIRVHPTYRRASHKVFSVIKHR